MEESLDELLKTSMKKASQKEETTDMEKKTEKMMAKWMRRRHKTQTFDPEEIPTSHKKKKGIGEKDTKRKRETEITKTDDSKKQKIRDDLPPVFHSILHEPCRLENNGNLVCHVKFERICGGNTLFGQPLKLYPNVTMNMTKQTKVQDVKKWLVPPADRILFNVVPHSDHNALENLNRKRKLDNFKKQKKANERICAVTFGREQILHLVPAGRFQEGILASQLKFLKMEDKIKVKVNYFMAIGKR